jgi:hypothetical protein
MLSFSHKVAIALMICIAVLLARIDQTSSTIQPIEKKETAATYNQDGNWKKWREPIVVVTLLLAAVGIGQLGLFWRQLHLIRDSLTPARDAAIAARNLAAAQKDDLQATHRPLIRIKHLWITNDISQTVPITVKIVCVNVGTANAILGQIGIRCHVVGNEYLLPADPAIDPVLNLGLGVLVCGRNWTIPGNNPADNLSTGYIMPAHEWADVQRGHARLYCLGWVSYLDTAERMRITGFCRVLEPPDANTVLTPTNGRFRVCKHPDYEYQD